MTGNGGIMSGWTDDLAKNITAEASNGTCVITEANGNGTSFTLKIKVSNMTEDSTITLSYTYGG